MNNTSQVSSLKSSIVLEFGNLEQSQIISLDGIFLVTGPLDAKILSLSTVLLTLGKDQKEVCS